MADRSFVLSYDREAIPLGEILDRQVELLQAAHRRGDPVAAELLRAARQGANEELPDGELTREDAEQAIASNHGYADWAAAREHAATMVDTRFEAAADAIHWGDLDVLRDLLDSHPPLISARSPFPHHCALLHHVAANGVEVERQMQSPRNAPEIMSLLLDRGAEPDAACDLYGGGPGMTPMCLVVSSCVPAQAGVQPTLVEVLCRGGALPDGPEDDGVPLRTAIMFGYPQAAEALVRCGARVDNLVFCAALGDLAGVESCFGADGALVADQAGVAGAFDVPEERLLDYAMIQAAAHDRREVAGFLLAKHPDLSYAEPHFGATARGAARHFGHAEMAAMIDERRAPSS